MCYSPSEGGHVVVVVVVLQTQRVGCVPSCCRLNPNCVMCGGRSSSLEDHQYDLPTMERLSRLDPGVHPILSFSDGEPQPHTPHAMDLGASPVSAERQQAPGSFPGTIISKTMCSLVLCSNTRTIRTRTT